MPMQLDKLDSLKTRVPKKVVEIGCGVGALGLCYSYLDIENVMFDPQKNLNELFQLSVKNFKLPSNKTKLCHDFEDINWDGVDTVIFCESIEHIYKETFFHIFECISRQLQKSKGRMIVVNTIDYHPIIISSTPHDHVHLIDDELYDIISEGKTTIYREGSHLILEWINE